VAPQGDVASAQSLASSDNAFGLALYPEAVAASGRGNNVIVSPYSVSAVLRMLDTGAAGRTASQIQTVLHLAGTASSGAEAYATLACADERDGSSDGNQLSIADSLWAQKGITFEPSFLTLVSTSYGAPVQQVDFGGNPAGATSEINQWVSMETQGVIPTLLEPGDVGQGTRLVLVNALYFKGSWATAFDPALTAPAPFTLADGTPVQVPTMWGSNLQMSTASVTADLTALELPYKGGALAMDFLMPAGPLAEYEASLAPDTLGATLDSLTSLTDNVTLPKFSFESRVDLVPILKSLGMVDAFGSGADFSGIDGAKDLSVSFVVQEAKIEVDERGTVAAAATALGADGGTVTPVLRIDHPFLFLIRDTHTGSILFMGRVEDPRKSS